MGVGADSSWKLEFECVTTDIQILFPYHTHLWTNNLRYVERGAAETVHGPLGVVFFFLPRQKIVLPIIKSVVLSEPCTTLSYERNCRIITEFPTYKRVG